jgi:hypothetical protein
MAGYASPTEVLMDASNERTLPLSQRGYDWIFIIVFSAFVFTSFAADLVNAVMRPDPHSGYFWARAVYNLYAVGNDPLLIANPVFLRAMTAISAFLFGPFYVVLVIAFVKGKNWIRPLALVYAGMIVESMIVLLAVEFAGDLPLYEMMGAGGVKSAAQLAEQGLTPWRCCVRGSFSCTISRTRSSRFSWRSGCGARSPSPGASPDLLRAGWRSRSGRSSAGATRKGRGTTRRRPSGSLLRS